MKKLSYYVAAFALCCGVSQTLTSCIEETEEPQEVKEMRQAEIAKLNAEAQKTKAEAANQEIENAIREVDKAVKEGASAEEIAKTIANYKSQALSFQKSNATALLPAELNAACPSYKNFIVAQATYLGGIVNGADYGEGTKAAFEAAEEALNTSVDEIYDQAVYIAGKEADVTAATNALNSTKKFETDYNTAYNDGTAVAKPASDLHSFSTTDTYKKDDADAAANKANSVVVFTYLKAVAQADLDKATNALALAKENKTGAYSWTNNSGTGVYDNYLAAKAENDRAEAAYNDLKAKYEGELAALQSIK